MANSSSRAGRNVIWVCVHTAEGIRKAADLRAFFERSTNSSAHAVADDFTLLDNLVSYSQAAWTLRNGNRRSDNLELCGFASWSRDEWLNNHKGMLNNAAAWIKARCTARGIPIRKLDAAGVRRGDAGVIGHVDYTNGTGDGTHWDPGPGFPWDYVIARASSTPAPNPAGTAIRNGEDPVMIDTYPDGTRELVGLKAKLDAGGKPTGDLEPTYEARTWVLPYTLPVGATSAMISDAWISVKAAGGGAIEYVRLMSIRNAAQYSMPGGGYPVDKEFHDVKSDTDRISIKAADGQDQFTVIVRSSVAFSVCVETMSK